MKKRLFSLLLALAMVLCALPAGNVSAASTADNFDLLSAYINTNGTEDSNGIMSLYDGFEDTENGMEYYFVLQNLGNELSFQLMIYSLTDPGVDCMTSINIARTGSTANVEFIMLFYYDGDYVDAVTDSRTINRAAYTYGQEFNVAAGGTFIPADDASQMYTATMQMLSEYWDMMLAYELGFGFNGLGFTAFEGYQPVGFSLNGTVTSYGSGDTIVTLSNANGESASVIADPSTGEYGFTGIPAGTYTLTISKANHVTQEYTVEIEDDMVLDCTINLTGDVNGDGKVNMKDWNRLYDHVTEVDALSGYALECADVNSDGKVNMKDWNRLYDHISEVNPLW